VRLGGASRSSNEALRRGLSSAAPATGPGSCCRSPAVWPRSSVLSREKKLDRCVVRCVGSGPGAWGGGRSGPSQQRTLCLGGGKARQNNFLLRTLFEQKNSQGERSSAQKKQSATRNNSGSKAEVPPAHRPSPRSRGWGSARARPRGCPGPRSCRRAGGRCRTPRRAGGWGNGQGGGMAERLKWGSNGWRFMPRKKKR